MARLKLTLEFEGSRYVGWQAQRGERTIQGMLMKAADEAFGEEVEFHGAGRTDSGVHALAQVAHFDLDSNLTTQAILKKLNLCLPYDINLLSIEKVSNSFNARHDAVARSYIYQISTTRSAFGKHYCWWIRDPLDVGRMKSAAKLFVGLKDFQSFTDDAGDQNSTKVDLLRMDVHEHDNVILLHFVGSHFLWKMIRRIAGVLVEIGFGTLGENRIEDYFKRHSAEPASFTAPPSGLFLHRVYYPNDKADYQLKNEFATSFPNSVHTHS